MKKKITVALSMLCLLALVIALASCGGHEHAPGNEWKNDDANHWHECAEGCGEKLDSAAHTFEDNITKAATCTEKGQLTQTCTACGYVKTSEIATLAHDFTPATCQAPKTCKNCNATEGGLGEHTGGTLSCIDFAVCAVCSESYGSILPHDYADATCTAPRTCTVCGDTEGVENGHSGGTATCTELAVCTVCSVTYGELLPHEGGTATCSTKATCDVCAQEYGDFAFHTVDKGACTACGETLYVVDAGGIGVIQPSHENGGAANADKLFDGEKQTTGIYTVGDKEYSPAAVGDFLAITLKSEIYISEIAIWQTGNWSTATIEFFDGEGNRVYGANMSFTNVLDRAGDSVAAYIKLDNTYKVQIIKITCTELKWNDGKTEKISEIEIFVSRCTEHIYVDASCEAGRHCVYCGDSEGEALGHRGGTATCTEKAICEVCGKGYGEEPAGHQGGEATCTEKAICQVCENAYGEPNGHRGGTATCTELAICEVCETGYGDYYHQGGTLTCTEQAVCSLCNTPYGPMPEGHRGGTATCEAKAQCEKCGQEYGDYNHKGGTATCTTLAKCDNCGQEYGEYKHTYDHSIKKCSTCGATFTVLGADDIESITASHEDGGAANVDKLFDGKTASTGIYTVGDLEYSPNAVGDEVLIVFNEAVLLNDVVAWQTGNWSYADFYFYDEDGNQCGKATLVLDNILEGAGNSAAKSLKINISSKIKSVKIVATGLKWDSGKTSKISEIEFITNTVAAE